MKTLFILGKVFAACLVASGFLKFILNIWLEGEKFDLIFTVLVVGFTILTFGCGILALIVFLINRLRG